jgi:hypothetical protein
MQSVVFWLVVAGTSLWSVQWLLNAGKGAGYKLMIVPVLFLWMMIEYFWQHPELSRYHMLWMAPALVVAEMFITAPLLGALRGMLKR